MINILNNLMLLRSRSGSADAFIEVVDMLTTHRDSCAEYSVLFDGADTGFKSSVQAINARKRVMVIESPGPEIAVSSIRAGQPLTLTTVTHGREMSFRSRYLEPFMPALEIGYQIEMPKVLGTAHPRDALRLMLDELRPNMGISLIDKYNRAVNGVVKNISKTGVGMHTENVDAGSLQDSGGTVNCLIDLQDSKEISCKMNIKNVQQQVNGKSSTYVGGRMSDISRKDSDVLTKFIEDLKDQMLESIVSRA